MTDMCPMASRDAQDQAGSPTGSTAEAARPSSPRGGVRRLHTVLSAHGASSNGLWLETPWHVLEDD